MYKVIIVLVVLFIAQRWENIRNTLDALPPEVVMYGTPECGYCTKARDVFDSKSIDYIEYNINISTEAYDEFKELGGIGTPLIKINDDLIQGYNKEHILQTYERNRR